MPKNHTPLTAERLRELLSYDPETGVFRWKVAAAKCVKVGDIAGWSNDQGYLRIGLFGRKYQAHRLAWLYVYGMWPADQTDHINGIRSDNAIANLREATNAENQQNLSIRKDNTSKHPGVYWHSRCCKWSVQVQLGGRNHHVGYFTNIADGIAARVKAKAEYHAFQPYDRGAK